MDFSGDMLVPRRVTYNPLKLTVFPLNFFGTPEIPEIPSLETIIKKGACYVSFREGIQGTNTTNSSEPQLWMT